MTGYFDEGYVPIMPFRINHRIRVSRAIEKNSNISLIKSTPKNFFINFIKF